MILRFTGFMDSIVISGCFRELDPGFRFANRFLIRNYAAKLLLVLENGKFLLCPRSIVKY